MACTTPMRRLLLRPLRGQLQPLKAFQTPQFSQARCQIRRSHDDALDRLLSGNRTFCNRLSSSQPHYFSDMGKGQAPEVLWIGCADSRIPETTICDLRPGDIFVHRNIANVLRPGDINAASVIEYAVVHLGVKKVVVCGHTKCGGANAGLTDGDLGEPLNTWLEPVRTLRKRNAALLDQYATQDEKANKLAELNVQMSLDVLKQHPAVAKKLAAGAITIHGLIYDIPSGTLKVI